MTDWKPIETAPMTGEYVLVVKAGRVPAVARWSDKFGHWSEFDDDEYAIREGEDIWGLTHWAPLPEQPAPDGDRQ